MMTKQEFIKAWSQTKGVNTRAFLDKRPNFELTYTEFIQQVRDPLSNAFDNIITQTDNHQQIGYGVKTWFRFKEENNGQHQRYQYKYYMRKALRHAYRKINLENTTIEEQLDLMLAIKEDKVTWYIDPGCVYEILEKGLFNYSKFK